VRVLLRQGVGFLEVAPPNNWIIDWSGADQPTQPYEVLYATGANPGGLGTTAASQGGEKEQHHLLATTTAMGFICSSPLDTSCAVLCCAVLCCVVCPQYSRADGIIPCFTSHTRALTRSWAPGSENVNTKHPSLPLTLTLTLTAPPSTAHIIIIIIIIPTSTYVEDFPPSRPGGQVTSPKQMQTFGPMSQDKTLFRQTSA
jgi:hypothetical protein